MLRTNKPEELMRSLTEAERTVDIQACVSSPTLKSLERLNLGQNLRMALDLQILRLASSLNLSRNISEAQVGMIVTDLVELFPHETMEDFILVFKRMRQGHYGEFYSSLDGSTIIKCMNKHLEEKAIHREKLHKMQKNQTEQIDIQNVIKSYQELNQKKDEPKPKQKLSQEDSKEEAYRQFRAEYIASLSKNAGPES